MSKGSPPDNPNQRRSHNKKLALALANAGLYVFPSSGKVPLALAWERADTAIGSDGVEEIKAAARAKAAAKNRDFDEDTFVGSTVEPLTVKAMWKRHPDAVPSISLGPSRLLVLDADIDGNRHGPMALRQWFADERIDIANCPITRTQSGAEHVYFRADTPLKSHIGKTMAAMYVQVKSTGGQVVAPGAWREDGKRYTSLAIQPGLMSSYAADVLPAVPAPVLALQQERSDVEVGDEQLAELIAELKSTPLTDTDDIAIDIRELKAKDEEFAALLDDPSGDTSHNRFTFLKCLQREYGTAFTPSDYLALLQDAEGMGDFVGDGAQKQGEWNYRNFVRDLVNSRTGWSISDGTAFGVADEDGEYMPTHYIEAKAAAAERKADAVWKVENLTDLEQGFEPINWLIEDVIEVGTSGIPYGPTSIGKTAIWIDIGLRIAHGLAWNGRRVQKSAVLYIAQEGQRGAKRRVQAWMKRARLNELELDPKAAFFMVRRQIDLFSNEKDYRTIRKEAREIEERTGRKVGLIVVDTFRAALVGGDENKQPDTSIITRYMNELAIRTGACVVAPHHTGKDVERGAVGSSNIIGSVDWSIEMSEGRIETKKVRDAESGQVFGFKIIPVEVGKDSFDKPTIAVVAEECEPARKKKPGKKKGTTEDVKEADFGVADDGDSSDGAGGDCGAVSGRLEAVARDTADAIARSIAENDLETDDEGYVPATRLIEACEALQAIAGPNFARKLKSQVFGNEFEVKTEIGWLRYDPAKGRRGTRFKIGK